MNGLRQPYLTPGCWQGHTVEEIIQGWNSELDARAQAFARHAQALQEWDRAILARRHALLAVEEDVIKVRLLVGLVLGQA